MGAQIPSRLEFLCDKVMESAWLAALILIPLFFNPYGFQTFDSAKAHILPSLALIAGFAWILKKVDFSSRTSLSRTQPAAANVIWWRLPLLVPMLLLASTLFLSTVLSVAPRISWWGSYGRMQGAFTTFSYMVLFWVLHDGLRTHAQWRRIQYVVMLTSLTASAYGILQHFNRDPLMGWQVFSGRITGTEGNPIFLAGYLIMALPITLERMLSDLGAVVRTNLSVSRILPALGTTLVFLSQVIAIVLAGSRGPWIGIAAGLYLSILIYLVTVRNGGTLRIREIGMATGVGALGFALFSLGLWGIARFSHGKLVIALPSLIVVCAIYVYLLVKGSARWLWLSWLLQAAVPTLFFIMLTVFPSARISSAVSKTGQILTGSEFRLGTIEVRRMIWRGVVELMRKNEPLIGFGNAKDGLSVVRPWIGYGPETMDLVSSRYFQPGFTLLEQQNTVWDRSHNDSFDTLISTGILGLVAKVILYFGILYYALQSLNLIQGGRDHKVYLTLCVLSLLLFTIVPCLLRMPDLAGIGVMGGVMVAIFLYTVYAGFGQTGEPTGRPDNRTFVLLSLLAAIVAHLVEIHVGIATTVTQTYFYLFTAAYLVFGTRQLIGEEAESRGSELPDGGHPGKVRQKAILGKVAKESRPKKDRFDVLPYAVLATIILAVIDWDLISVHGEPGMLETFWGSWTRYAISKSQQATGVAGISIVLILIAVGFALAAKNARKFYPPERVPGSSLLLFVTVTGVGWLLFGLFLSAQIEAGNALLSPEAAINVVSNLLQILVACLGILLVILIMILWRSEVHLCAKWSRSPMPALGLGVLFLAACIILINGVTLQPIRADMYFKLGEDTRNSGAFQQALLFYERATSTVPREDRFQFFLGQAMMQAATGTEDPQMRGRIFDRAEEILKKAVQLSPFNSLNIRNLASCYVSRGEKEKDSGLRERLLRDALSCYTDASRLFPNDSDLYKEWGRAHFLLGQIETARKLYRRSLDLYATNDATHQLLGELESSQGNLDEALRDFTEASRINPKNMRLQTQRVLLLRQLKRYDEQVASNLDAVAGDISDPATLHQVSVLFAQIGDYRRALSYAQRVYALLPRNQRSAYYPIIQALQGHLNQ